MLELLIPKPYTFATSVCDHGWPRLAPNQWLTDQQMLQRVEQLTTGRVVLLHLSAEEVGEHVRLKLDVQADRALTGAETGEIVAAVRWMLKLDEDFTAFYALAAQGRGRLLRSPTLWEDVVKTLEIFGLLV